MTPEAKTYILSREVSLYLRYFKILSKLVILSRPIDYVASVGLRDNKL